MYYVDTRGKGVRIPFSKVLPAGTAFGGGLCVPDGMFAPVELEVVSQWSYPSIATHVMYPFVNDMISFEDLDEIHQSVFTTKNFGTDEIVPIDWFEDDIGIGHLQLANGPTGAFKDLAMKPVARLLDCLLEKEDSHAVIVVSTSGDTGGAAVEAFRGRKRATLFVLYPNGRVSTLQQLMMTTAQDKNIHAIAIDDGVFDDCQGITKVLFDDAAFVEKYRLTGVNSINWARIAEQIVYWVACGAQMYRRQGNKPFDVTVPSGNFGDSLSAHYARLMGVPIDTIVVATNQNDVLHKLFSTGIYERGKKVLPSTSPSMDIQVASNIERLFFEGAGRDGEQVASIMSEFAQTGRADCRSILPYFGRWASGSASEEEVATTIRYTFARYNRLIDPHTAVARWVAEKYRRRDVPMVIAETAKAEKFPETMKQLGFDVSVPERWRRLAQLPEKIVHLGNSAQEVKQYIIDTVR